MSVTDTAPADVAPAPEWAKVEILGHRTRFGLTREVERFGVKMIRIDVFQPDANMPCLTEEYSGSAIFSFTRCTETCAVCGGATDNPPHEAVGRICDDCNMPF